MVVVLEQVAKVLLAKAYIAIAHLPTQQSRFILHILSPSCQQMHSSAASTEQLNNVQWAHSHVRYNRQHMSPFKRAPSCGRAHTSFPGTKQICLPKWHHNWFIHFCTAHLGHQYTLHRQTHRRVTSVAKACTYTLHGGKATQKWCN